MPTFSNLLICLNIGTLCGCHVRRGVWAGIGKSFVTIMFDKKVHNKLYYSLTPLFLGITMCLGWFM